jgi:hypothetical protein
MVRRFFILGSLVILLIVPVKPVDAASTVECHCFRDRSFSPANPTAFDPYLLATVQNRLLAYSFGLSRKEIVGQKMSGASGDHLWIAHWLAMVTRQNVESLQGSFSRLGSWREVVTSRKGDPEKLGSHFMAALITDDSHQLAWAVVTQVFDRFLDVPDTQLVSLRRSGASLKETILVSLLALAEETSAERLLEKARRHGNWGSVFIDSGKTIEGIDKFLAESFSQTPL